MAPPNMSVFGRALEMSTSTVIQPHRIRNIQEEEHEMVQGEEHEMVQGEEHEMVQGEEHEMVQGEEHEMDAVAYPQNLQPPGPPAPQEKQEEQGAHSMIDLLLNCIMGESGCLRIFQEFEHYLFGDNSSSDCDAPEDDSSVEESKDDDDDEVAIADGQSKTVNVREQENNNEDFPLSPAHLEDEEFTSENGFNSKVLLSDSQQELQIPRICTIAPQMHAMLDQLVSYPTLASSTCTVEEGTASTFNLAAEEPESNTSEDVVNDTSKC